MTTTDRHGDLVGERSWAAECDSAGLDFRSPEAEAGRADHREPYPGDHGIRWESLNGAEFPDWALST